MNTPATKQPTERHQSQVERKQPSFAQRATTAARVLGTDTTREFLPTEPRFEAEITKRLRRMIVRGNVFGTESATKRIILQCASVLTDFCVENNWIMLASADMVRQIAPGRWISYFSREKCERFFAQMHPHTGNIGLQNIASRGAIAETDDERSSVLIKAGYRIWSVCFNDNDHIVFVKPSRMEQFARTILQLH